MQTETSARSKNGLNKAMVLQEMAYMYFKEHQRSKKSQTEIINELIRLEPRRKIYYGFLPDNDRAWLDLLAQNGIKIMDEGWLLINRYEKSEKTTKIIPQQINGINTAIRMHFHILSGYSLNTAEKKSEFKTLKTIEGVIENANSLLTEWSRASEKDKEKIQKQLVMVILKLEKCRNIYKVDIKTQIKNIIGLKDSLSRSNPGALAAKTIRALNSLGKRLNDIRLISSIIAFRKELLVMEKKRMQMEIKKAYHKIKAISLHVFFKGGYAGNQELHIMEKNINFALHLLGKIFIYPYLQQSGQARLCLENCKKYLRARDSRGAKLKIQDTLSILKTNVENLDGRRSCRR